MAYTTNPHLPQVRGQAADLVRRGWSTRKVGRYFGFSQSVIVKWGKKAKQRGFGAIPTASSRPKTNPQALSRELVSKIITERSKRQRCSEHVYQELKRQGVEVSLRFVRRAQKAASFRFEMIQTDHGPEFSTWFTHGLWTMKLGHRHSRVRQSNDNAHVERFNRTLQEECLDKITHTILSFKKVLLQYLKYYNTEKTHMGINYQIPIQLIPRS